MAADSPSSVVAVLEDLNLLLSTLDLGLNGSGEQGGLTQQGVQSGGHQEDTIGKSCVVVLHQVRILEQALMVQGVQTGLGWDAGDIVDVAVAHGMIRPVTAKGSQGNGMAER